MNIHIALVGGATVPVYQGLLKSKSLFGADPDLIILLHSERSKSEAKYLENFYKEFENEKANFEYIELPANDIVETSRIVHNLSNQEKFNTLENGVTVDITGGLKPWVIMLYRYFIPKAETNDKSFFIFYTDQTAGTTDIVNLQNFKKYIADLSIEQVLRLNGKCSKDDIDIGLNFSDYTEKDLNIIKIIETLFKKYPELMQGLTKVQLINQKNKIYDSFGHILSIETRQFQDMQNVEITIFRNKTDKNPTNYNFKSPHACDLLIKNHWFEVLLGQIIKNWPELTNTDNELKLGTIIRDKGIYQAEFDVIMNIQDNEVSRLLAIEGKSGKSDLNTIRQRASSIRKYAGTNALGIFATYKDIGPEKAAECRKNNIIPFYLRNDNNLHLSFEDAVKQQSDVLYEELNKAVLKSNK